MSLWPLIAQAGQQRVRVDRGWISVYTRDGTQLLDRVVRCPRQRSQPAATSRAHAAMHATSHAGGVPRV